MANQIKELNAGQAPSLLDTTKANELIKKINALTSSEATSMAELGGLSLKVSDDGKIELDITQETLEALQSSGLPEGFNEQIFTTIIDGNYANFSFLVKTPEE
jgi:hypothetical protein